jgi:hypothetical protein
MKKFDLLSIAAAAAIALSPVYAIATDHEVKAKTVEEKAADDAKKAADDAKEAARKAADEAKKAETSK